MVGNLGLTVVRRLILPYGITVVANDCRQTSLHLPLVDRVGLVAEGGLLGIGYRPSDTWSVSHVERTPRRLPVRSGLGRDRAGFGRNCIVRDVVRWIVDPLKNRIWRA